MTEKRQKQLKEADKRYKQKHPRGIDRRCNERIWRFLREKGLGRRTGESNAKSPGNDPYSDEEVWRRLETARLQRLEGNWIAALQTATSLRRQFAARSSAFGLRVRAFSGNIIRDAGIWYSDDLEALAAQVEKEWYAQRDFPNFAAALLSRAKMYLDQGRYREAQKLVNASDDIIKAKCAKSPSPVLTKLQFEVDFKRVRIACADDNIDRDQAMPLLDQLHLRAAENPTPANRLRADTEETLFRTHFGEYDIAWNASKRARGWLKGPLGQRPMLRIPIHRAEIELTLANDSEEEARYKLQEYWEWNRPKGSLYHHEQIERTAAKIFGVPHPIRRSTTILETFYENWPTH